MPIIAQNTNPTNPDRLDRLEGTAILSLADTFQLFVKKTISVIPCRLELYTTPNPVRCLHFAAQYSIRRRQQFLCKFSPYFHKQPKDISFC